MNDRYNNILSVIIFMVLFGLVFSLLRLAINFDGPASNTERYIESFILFGSIFVPSLFSFFLAYTEIIENPDIIFFIFLFLSSLIYLVSILLLMKHKIIRYAPMSDLYYLIIILSIGLILLLIVNYID